MRLRTLWLLLALAGTIITAAAIINLIGHITEIQDAASQPAPWQQLAVQTTVRHWTVISLICELASLGLWLAFARAWSKATPSGSAGLRYAVAIAAAVLAPCILLAIFALV